MLKKISVQTLPVMFTAAFLLMSSCATNPVTGKKDLMLLSEQQEINLGKQSDPGIVASFGLYPDETLQAFIDEKGQEMAKISHRPHLAYEFKILDSPVVNAFAVPGGYVYFTRGILAHFNNEAEFAGVLGHEIGHITARHSAKQYSKSILAQVGLIAGLVISPEFAQFADVAQQSIGLLFLKFSRDNESESDKLGVEYSTKIGYNAHHMANFFETLNRMRVQAGGESLPTFLSTHPDPLNRYENVHELAKKWQTGLDTNQLKENRNTYLNMIDGLVYGEDPRQGYVEDDVFYHPDLRFQYPVPTGWKTANSPQQVQHAPDNGKALIVFTLAQEKTLEEAARATVENNSLQVVESKSVKVGTMPAIAMVSDQQNPQNPESVLRIMTYLIQYGDMIYKFHGLSAKPDFSSFNGIFQNTFSKFRQLTDASKINRQPDRIKIVTVQADETLQSALSRFQVPAAKQEEIAILNSRKLEDPLSRGTRIKIVE